MSARALPSRALWLVLLLAGPVLAAAPAPVQLDVKGPGAPALRAGLQRALGDDYAAVRSKGLATQPSAQAVRASARRDAAAAVLVARTERSGGGRLSVSVRVFRASTGAPHAFLRWRVRSARELGSMPAAEAAQLRTSLAQLAPARVAAGRAREAESDALEASRAKAPSPAETAAARAPAAGPAAAEATRAPSLQRPAPPQAALDAPRPLAAAPRPLAAPSRSSTAPQEPAPEPPAEAPGPAPVAARFSVGGRVLSRRLQYTDDVRNALPRYRLPGGPALAVGVDWYPGAHRTHGLWANVGVTASAEILMAVRSVMPDASAYNTDSDSYRGGLTARLPLGAGELGLQATFGTHVFAFSGTPGAGAERLVPEVRYRSARAGLFGRLPLFERLTLVLDAGAHKVWETGELQQSYFPRSAVGAVDGALTGEWHLSSAWRLRVGAEYRRYYYAMHPEPGDRFIVGGALDEYLSGTVSLGFELR